MARGLHGGQAGPPPAHEVVERAPLPVGGLRHVLGRGAAARLLRQPAHLLAHARGWRFNAGPEGVVLVHRGRTPRREMSRVALTLEKLATVTERGRW